MSRTRQVEVRQGDDLRAIAARELNDPTRWPELARLNSLALPFITPSWAPSDRAPRTAIWGDAILVPDTGNAQRVPSPISTFGVDLALPRGRLEASATGDLAVVSGRDTIVQALGHRVKTVRGELVYHDSYGCLVSCALGLPAPPFVNLMAATWVYEALVEEPRLARVQAVDARVVGDTLQVAAVVQAADENTPIDLNLVLNP